MKVWNFKTQDLDEGIEPPMCNGLIGKYYPPVNISYNRKDGETIIEYLGERDNNGRKDNKKV